MRAPVIVMSFNRPHYLGQVLESLKAQAGNALEGREVHLFQDGAVNRYSRLRYAQDDEIAASIDLFRRHFPAGVVHASPDNIGICENFRRAELYAFEQRGLDCAYFFEDDLILSPAYLDMMDRLRAWAERMPNVAYFAAYGDYHAEREHILAHRRELGTLDHHWAFGLLRRHWLAMQPLLQPFYDVVTGNDYSRRDHRAIFRIYEAQSAGPRASSQDAAKAYACDRLGLWRSNTVLSFARYIGTSGQHMTPEAFAALGFAKTVVADEPIEHLALPGEKAIAEKLAQQHALFEAIRRDEFADLVGGLPARKYAPVRLCERDDVIMGYRLFLAREPESEDVIAQRVGRQRVMDFVAGLIGSEEFSKVSAAPPERLCTRDDVTWAYRLSLHRDPDGAHIYDKHIGVTDARALALSVWNDPIREKLWSQVELPAAAPSRERPLLPDEVEFVKAFLGRADACVGLGGGAALARDLVNGAVVSLERAEDTADADLILLGTQTPAARLLEAAMHCRADAILLTETLTGRPGGDAVKPFLREIAGAGALSAYLPRPQFDRASGATVLASLQL